VENIPLQFVSYSVLAFLSNNPSPSPLKTLRRVISRRKLELAVVAVVAVVEVDVVAVIAGGALVLLVLALAHACCAPG
jgi:hypothetical protein